jgi:hypothetical protein
MKYFKFDLIVLFIKGTTQSPFLWHLYNDNRVFRGIMSGYIGKYKHRAVFYFCFAFCLLRFMYSRIYSLYCLGLCSRHCFTRSRSLSALSVVYLGLGGDELKTTANSISSRLLPPVPRFEAHTGTGCCLRFAYCAVYCVRLYRVSKACKIIHFVLDTPIMQ